MEHLTDKELLDLLAAGGDSGIASHAHLTDCADCRARMEEYRRTWRVLGHWQGQCSAGDMAAAVVRAAEERQGPRGPWVFLRPWAAAAAVALLAMAVGFAAGQWSRSAPMAVPEAAAPEVTESEALEAAHLDALQAEPVGLAAALRMSYADEKEVQQ